MAYRGVPVTVVASLNVTVTNMRSPATNVSVFAVVPSGSVALITAAVTVGTAVSIITT